MNQNLKKRGQKLARRWERLTSSFRENSREHIQENLIDRISHAKQVRLLILEWGLLVVVIISLALTQAFWYKQSYSVSAYVDGGTYIEATVGRVNSLNPLFATTSSEKTLSKLLFATVSAVDYSGHIGLGLAESIRPDETGKNWTITLKEDLQWSDGHPLTLDDVEFTVGLIQNPAINTIYSGSFSGVTLERNENELIFHLPATYADFASTLNFPVLPKHILGETAASRILEHEFSSKPVTSGAFAFNATQSAGLDGEKLIYLSANPNYYRGQPMLDSFAVRTYSDETKIMSALISGEVTATAELSPLQDIDDNLTVYEKQTAIASGVYAFLNTTSPLMTKVEVRQAIRQGIDLTKLRSVLDGELALNYPIINSEIELSSYPELPAYDFEAARTVIQSIATSEQPLRLATINTGYFPKLAENLKGQLEALGFTVELTISEPGQEFLMSTIRPRNYDILIYEVELGADPDLLPYYHSTQASESGLNLSNYRNSIVDDLIVAARSTLNTELRVAKYEAFLRYWVSDVPAIGIYQSNLIYYYNKDSRSFSVDDRLVYPTDRFSGVEYWAVEKADKNRTP